MGIQISKFRISQFRSVEECEIVFDKMNVLFGQNNVGKSNILKALTIALGTNNTFSEQDIHIKKDEELSKTKSAIIDIMIQPTNEAGEITNVFSEFWVSVFTTDWISYDEDGRAFVGIRTKIEYNLEFSQYVSTKCPILQWKESVKDAECGRKKHFTQDMQRYMLCYYLDAQRDIIDDIKNKKSYFGRATSSNELPDEIVNGIEKDLNDINSKIIKNMPSINLTQKTLSNVGAVVNNDTVLQIEPISRKINDLQRGMDVKIFDRESAPLSISEQGMGTRSWTSVLTYGAFIENLMSQLKTRDPDAEIFVVLALEEPEAHLHTNAQKHLFEQIKYFPGQKIISTHSASILAQTPIETLIHIYKTSGQTKVHKINADDYKKEEIAIVQKELVRTRGELLFSSAIVLSEGITEEYVLPIFYKEYFKQDAFSSGISIVGIGGQRYKAFIHILKDFDIPWFIFSDGESSTIKTVENAVKSVYDHDSQEQMGRVVFLENGWNYEKYLVESGYLENIINAINNYERIIREELHPEESKKDPHDFFDEYIKKNNNKKNGVNKTGKKCSACGQEIILDSFNNFEGEEGKKRALLDLFRKNNSKVKYAIPIAEDIIANSKDKVPKKMIDLFEAIKTTLNLKEGERDGD